MYVRNSRKRKYRGKNLAGFFSLSLIEDERVHEWYFKIFLLQVVFLFFSLVVGRLLLIDSNIRNFQHCILLCLIARLESPHCEDFLWDSPLQMSVISVTQLWTLLMAPRTLHARIYILTLLKLIRKSYFVYSSLESMRDFLKDSGFICMFEFYVRG